MAQIIKWLFRLAGGAILLALVAVIGLYFLLSRSLPD